MTWIIAEDDRPILDLLSRFCELRGINLLAFEDGREVLEYLAKDPLPEPIPTFALLDVRMVHVQGPEVAAALRKHPTLNNIGIVLMTAFRLPLAERSRLLQESGADSLIQKPLPAVGLLIEAVEEIIARRKENAKSK
jgi:CheY-like chemotaxis protein